MSRSRFFGTWVRRFLLEYMLIDRGLSANTQKSYRDTFRLLLPEIAKAKRRSLDKLLIEDVTPALVKAFLLGLEKQRNCGAATRNQRLAAIRSLAKFIATQCPEHITWCGDLRAIPFKRSPQSEITYLEKDEMDAILMAPDRGTAQGRRDHSVLLFLYNSGARASEVAAARIGDLEVGSSDSSSVLIRGKGNKSRRCPLWAKTVDAIRPHIKSRSDDDHVFLNRRGNPLTRYGIHGVVERHAAKVAKTMPAISRKRVSPHTIRHTTATHLLRAGVDINTIRAWLGHVCLGTTNVYAEVDLEMKAKALATCDTQDGESSSWHEDAELMDFLNSL